MKFTCSQQSLSKALNTVSKAIQGRTTISTLRGILISAKDGKLTLTGSDIDITIQKTINADVKENGEIVIMAKILTDLIRKLPNDDVNFELNNNTMLVQCNKSKFNLLTLPKDEYPLDINIDEKNSFEIKSFDFVSMVRKTVFATSQDETKGVLTGVLMEINKNDISMIATDGFRMAISKKDSKNENESKIIIHGRFLNEISKIAMESDEDEIFVKYEKSKALFEIDNTKIFVRLLEGDYIDYNRIIPSELPINIKISKSGLLDSIERASLFSREGKNNLIKFSIKEDFIEISSRSDEGNILESINIEKEGADLDIGFNSKYLIEGLKIYDGENVKFEMNTSVSPCLMKEEEEKTIYLILPVRLSSNI